MTPARIPVYHTAAEITRLFGIAPKVILASRKRGILRVTAKTAGGLQLFDDGDVQLLARERLREIAAKRRGV